MSQGTHDPHVYFAPGRINLAAFPLPTLRGTVYMGEFNARHPDLKDPSQIPDWNGPRPLDYVRGYRLTRWDIGGAAHSRGGTLDHIFAYSHIQDWWLHVSSASPSLCFFLTTLPLASAYQYQLHPPPLKPHLHPDNSQILHDIHLLHGYYTSYIQHLLP